MDVSRDLTLAIKSQALDLGADLVGIASIDRFDHAPEVTKPTHYLPTATSVISIGIQISDGVCDVWGSYDEPGKSAGPYLFYGYGQVNMELGRIVHSLAKNLERMKYKVVIFPPTWTVSTYRFIERNTEGKFLGDFSHRHAAVAAGLGELGWHSLCITPQFGTRVRFCSVITSAPLEPDPLYQGQALCQPAKCKKVCVRICPTRAFSKEHEECQIGDKTLKYSAIDKIRCFYGILGYVKGSGGRTDVKIPDGPGDWKHFSRVWTESQHPADRTMFAQSPGLILGDFCGRCLLSCPAPNYQQSKGGIE